MEETKIYENSNFSDALILNTLREVIDALKERGYNPINQIVGYLISGDPGYISNHKEARAKIVKFERTKILEVLLKNYAG
ncbi:MAG: IreB family regulatory phosphoprotein [Bacilli bacterium]|nr:IreB family regulatory phosphoprotein [Bacilli bacterium]